MSSDVLLTLTKPVRNIATLDRMVLGKIKLEGGKMRLSALMDYMLVGFGSEYDWTLSRVSKLIEEGFLKGEDI
jgi:hypothetical protein